jgi:hypothetical protein
MAATGCMNAHGFEQSRQVGVDLYVFRSRCHRFSSLSCCVACVATCFRAVALSFLCQFLFPPSQKNAHDHIEGRSLRREHAPYQL